MFNSGVKVGLYFALRQMYKNEQRGPVRTIISLNFVFYNSICMLVCMYVLLAGVICSCSADFWLSQLVPFFMVFKGPWQRMQTKPLRRVERSPLDKNICLYLYMHLNMSIFSSYFIIMSRMIPHYGWMQNWDNFYSLSDVTST